MFGKDLGNNHSNPRMFDATLSYLASKETSLEEKKQAFDFFVDYVKNNHQEKIDLMVTAIKHICNNAPDEFKKYCQTVLL